MIRLVIRSILIIMLVVVVMWNGVEAAFERNDLNSFSSGLGFAYVAVPDGVNTIFYNPAGIASVKKIEVNINYNMMYPNINDQIVNFSGSIGGNLKFLYLGITYSSFSVSSLYQENIVEFSAGKTLGESVKIGINGNYFSIKYGNPDDNPVFSTYGTSTSAFGIDMGVMVMMTKDFTVGLSLENYNEPDISLFSNDTIDKIVRFGASYIAGKGDDWLISTEIDMEREYNTFMAGIRKSFFSRRASVSLGINLGNVTSITFGVIGKYKNIEAAYSYLYLTGDVAEVLGGSHLIGVRFSL